MRSKTIHYDDGENKADLTVSAATVLDGIRRTRLKTEARAEQSRFDADTFLLRLFTYADLCAVVHGYINGREVTRDNPLSFEELCALPEPLMIEVEDAVYALNPHWLPQTKAAEESESKKAVTTSTPG